MTDRAKFSLIFLTWNPGNGIMESLDSVADQNYNDYEVIIVDNNSTDGSIERVAEKFGERLNIRIFRNDENVGFSAGMNQGIEKSEGEYICCYNHDTILSDGYLTSLDNVVSPDAVWTTARVSHRVSDSDKVIRLLTKYRFTLPYRVNSMSGLVDVNFLSGDGVIVPRNIYNSLDREIFDESMPLRGEDVEFSLFLRHNDVPIRAILDTYTIHPDKERMYAPTVKNGLRLLRTIRARVSAHGKWGGPLDISLAVLSVVTTPLIIYGTDIPRSEEKFSRFVNE